MKIKTLSILEKVKNGELTPKEAQEQLFTILGVDYCDCEKLQHKLERNQFPYGDDIEYDECCKCYKKYNFRVL